MCSLQPLSFLLVKVIIYLPILRYQIAFIFFQFDIFKNVMSELVIPSLPNKCWAHSWRCRKEFCSRQLAVECLCSWWWVHAGEPWQETEVWFSSIWAILFTEKFLHISRLPAFLSESNGLNHLKTWLREDIRCLHFSV